ncbi:carboxymuconolactone decarboxylase family protein [Sphingorhabdus sp. YGSMI21]|uniref:carboxymuconolactone decarboxylase family protein n=1 Tax=Sphingorhabdus sp. YGSMI21 TaxID=2077182 RepID=UPI000C1F6DF6|nr:carboxymuconolactone decarboxylase family protein [Sphingorhabdus sp. YGSMI21]ATW04426.1 hypothetical protein CHN51_13455 [Sphingorhabdus sp. YGSMI21]
MSGGLLAGGVAETALGQLLSCEKTLDGSSLGMALLELVRLRVSQINGCHYCISRHKAALRACGETTERIDALADWQASGRFSERESAALLWAEALTRLPEATAAPEAVTRIFDTEEQAELALAIAMINLWNRMALALGW